MPRTKHSKRGRKTKQNKSVKTELDPNIVVKQEPEDPPPDSMKFETEGDVDVDDNFAVKGLKDYKCPNVYSITQLRNLGDDMFKKQRAFFDQLRRKADSQINLIKLKIQPEFRHVPIGEVIRKQGLKPSGSNDLLSVSQQVVDNNSTALSVEQPNKTLDDDLQKGCTTDTENEDPSTMNKFKTPAICLPTPRFGTVTPKVGPDSPITILRLPQSGEVVISMKGSPVMLNAAREDKPTLTIPMANGTVMSILPQKDLRTAQLPQEIDPGTCENLKIILENLKDLIINTETPKP